eukprot:TRINITY_DN6785_c0_g2_i4.p1 TRINITY_DN6785_c0_g2~~TRINITY_DN6785_c0_g2_i4.p1  ORF type:complete len:124 (-),score=15.04 TRINITY_DN6785_c0_g2_i4:115-486(-)
MCLFTSHTKPNPNRKFWGCPKWTEGYGCTFLWKDKVSIDRSTVSNAVPCHIVDIRPDLQRLSTNLDGLKREIETKNRHEQLEMEGKHEKKKLVAKQLLVLEKNFYVLLLTAFLICDAISMRYM